MHTTCIECRHLMRPYNAPIADHPGTVQHTGGGLCRPCYRQRKRTGGEVSTRQFRRPQDVIEDVEWLTEWGNFVDSPHRIAERLGYSEYRSLMKVLRRAGRHDLLDRLTVRNEMEDNAA